MRWLQVVFRTISYFDCAERSNTQTTKDFFRSTKQDQTMLLSVVRDSSTSALPDLCQVVVGVSNAAVVRMVCGRFFSQAGQPFPSAHVCAPGTESS